MDLPTILLYVGIGAIVLFVVQYLVQIHQIRNGVQHVGIGRVFINWLLIFCIIGGFGGRFYLHHRSSSQAAATQQTVKKKHSDADRIYIRYDKDKAKLNRNGEAPMKIVVSPNTRVKIYGHNTHTLFKTFKAKKGDGPITLHYTFTENSRYDIVAIRGNQRIVKTIRIRGHHASSSSSVSSNSSSSSRSSSAKSSSNSSSSNNRSSSNGGSGSTGSSYSGGGGSSYSGGGGGYSGGGGGGSYTPPARPSAPAAPSAPATPPNGTGAMH